MPRTVEHIVECHKAARRLIAAGKPIWDKCIDVKAIIHEDQKNVTAAHIADISVRIAKLIRWKAPAAFFDMGHGDFDFDFVDAVEAMEQCTVESLAVDEENGVSPEGMFNQWLTAIYDWADVNRIWMGN